MGRKRSGLAWGRLARRSISLALVLVTVWLLSLTTAVPALPEAVEGLGQDPEFVVSTLATQLAWTAPEEGVTASLDGWGKLLLNHSPLLSGSADAVENYLAQQEQQEAPAQETPPQGDADDRQEEPLEPIPGGQVVEHTSTGKDDGTYLSAQKVYIKNDTSKSVNIPALASQAVDLNLGAGPQILIYHTHGSEAYTQTEDSRYTESDAYRTTDCTKNVVLVGEAMAEVFRSMGFEVIHDTTLYDYPVYNGAYERSRDGIGKWLAQYPTIKFVLDVHRDALVSEGGAAYKLISQEGDEKVAQVMLVVGSDASGASHPRWQENLALAVKLQLLLTGQYDQLARPITLRSTRFNQDTSPGALLVEVGGHGNTLAEAIAGGKKFAQTAGELLKTMTD